MEEISEETPVRENPTNHYPQANIEDVDGQNDSIVEAATTANSPGDHAKDNSTEDSNLDDSNTSPEEITKSQQKKRKKTAKQLALEEEGIRHLFYFKQNGFIKLICKIFVLFNLNK